MASSIKYLKKKIILHKFLHKIEEKKVLLIFMKVVLATIKVKQAHQGKPTVPTNINTKILNSSKLNLTIYKNDDIL